MQFVASIDPVTRLEGHMKVEVTIDKVDGVQQVVDARSVGTLFRGFERILINRDPRDARHITERICGVCPVAHGMAAVNALDRAYGVTAPNNARVMRNLVHGANFVDSHILHFYLLALPDFIDGPAMPPWQPGWRGDKRLTDQSAAALVGHYVTALDMRRKAHEMGAIFGGRLPHPPTYLVGGFTTHPKAADIAKFKTYLAELIPFIRDVYIPDAELLASVYSDYLAIGGGNGNLLAFGVFELDNTRNTLFFRRGRIVGAQGSAQTLDMAAIREEVTHSWYDQTSDNQSPSLGTTLPVYPKEGAYSWLKAPRYNGAAYETGALARMWINGAYTRGVSVMDRHLAKAQEALMVAQAMQSWIDGLVVGGPVYVNPTRPTSAEAVGLTEAPRGALGHWIKITNSVIERYQVVTPTCWNASPRDGAGQPGPLEQALIGTPVENIDEPIEVLRVIHSFDPCLDCAVHVMRPDAKARVFGLPHYHGGEEVSVHAHGHSHDHAHPHTQRDHGHGSEHS